MKKLVLKLFFLVFHTIPFFTLAQTNNKIKPKFELSLAVNNIYTPMGLIGDATIGLTTDGFWNGGGAKTDASYSFSIIPRYHLSKNLLLRFEFGITRIKENRTITVSSTNGSSASLLYPLTLDAIEQKTYRYIPSIQWSAFKDKRIDLHIGLSASYLYFSNLMYNSHYEIRNIVPDSLVFEKETTRNVPGGYGLGIGSLAGFDYFLFKNVSIGAEFSNAFIYYNLGGQTTITETTYYPTNVSGIGTSVIPELYKGMRLEKIFSSFNISIYL